MADPQKVAEMVAERAAQILLPMSIEMEAKNWPHDLRMIMWGAVADMAAGMVAQSKTALQTKDATDA